MRATHADVVAAAGSWGCPHVVVPPRRFRTDLVQPVLSMMVHGVAAPQGSKRSTGVRTTSSGKLIGIMKEDSPYLHQWRETVTAVAGHAARHWEKVNGHPWEPLNEPVVVGLVITRPPTVKATRNREMWVAVAPDVDKMQRAAGDALAPIVPASIGKGYPPDRRAEIREQWRRINHRYAALRDDQLITGWADPVKVYPPVEGDGYPAATATPGVTIQIWRATELAAAAERPIVDGVITATDARSWGALVSGESWDAAAQRLWDKPSHVLGAGDSITVTGNQFDDTAARVVLRTLALHGPAGQIHITEQETQ